MSGARTCVGCGRHGGAVESRRVRGSIERHGCRGAGVVRVTALPALLAAVVIAGPAVSATAVDRASPKLSVREARLDAGRAQLHVRMQISLAASGKVEAVMESAGRRTTVKGGISGGRVRLRAPITKTQARLGVANLRLTYAGDRDTRPQVVRMLAGRNPARLAVTDRPKLVGVRFRTSGTISRRAGGAVSVELKYAFGGQRRALRLVAPVRDGTWAIDTNLSARARAEITGRSGRLDASTLYPGHASKRIGGAMSALDVLGEP